MLDQKHLLSLLQQAESELPDVTAMEVPSRTVYLPLAWEDSQTQLATERYMQTVRPDAPWCPDNVEFIRRINGLRLKASSEGYRIQHQLFGDGFGRCVFGCTCGNAAGPTSSFSDHQI